MAKKFAVHTTIGAYSVKRSVTIAQVEVLFLACVNAQLIKGRKRFDLVLSFHAGDLYKAVTIKKIPNGYLGKFEPRSKT